MTGLRVWEFWQRLEGCFLAVAVHTYGIWIEHQKNTPGFWEFMTGQHRWRMTRRAAPPGVARLRFPAPVTESG